MTQPDAAATSTLCQERRMSALKAQKRRFSKNMMMDGTSANNSNSNSNLDLDLDLSTRGVLSLSLSFLSLSSHGHVADTGTGSAGTAGTAGTAAETSDAADNHSNNDELLQFALKKKVRSTSSHSLSPAPRRQQRTGTGTGSASGSRLPRKCKSTSDTMPRIYTRPPCGGRLLGSSASSLAFPENKKERAESRQHQDRLAESHHPASSPRQSPFRVPKSPGARTCTGIGTPSSSCTNTMSSSAKSSRSLGGVFKSMALPKLKKYENLDDDDDNDQDKERKCLIQNLPESLRFPFELRVSPDDASSVSSVSMNADDDEVEDEDGDDESCAWECERSVFNNLGSSSHSSFGLLGAAHESFAMRRPSLLSTCTGTGTCTTGTHTSSDCHESRTGTGTCISRRSSRGHSRSRRGLPGRHRSMGSSSNHNVAKRNGGGSSNQASQRRRSSAIPTSHWASTSLLDASRTSLGGSVRRSSLAVSSSRVVSRDQGSFSGSNNNSGCGAAGLHSSAMFPTKIRRFAPSQA